MANTIHMPLYWNRRMLKYLGGGVGLVKKVIPWEVSTTKVGNTLIVSAIGYRKEIEMRDTLLMVLFGQRWEEKLRKAQHNAFMTSYKIMREDERRDQQVRKVT